MDKRLVRIGKDAADAEADATCAQLDGGFLRFFDEAPPGEVGGALTGQPLLAECRFGNPAFKRALNGRADATPLTPDPSTRGRGRAQWFQAVRADGKPLFDGACGTNPDDYACFIPSTEIIPGMEFHVASFYYVRPAK
jgi:hypothetical protein